MDWAFRGWSDFLRLVWLEMMWLHYHIFHTPPTCELLLSYLIGFLVLLTLTGSGNTLLTIFFKPPSQYSKLPFEFWLCLVLICQESISVYFRFSYYQALFILCDLWPRNVFCHLPQLFSIEFVIPGSANKAGMRNTFFLCRAVETQVLRNNMWIRRQAMSDILVLVSLAFC